MTLIGKDELSYHIRVRALPKKLVETLSLGVFFLGGEEKIPSHLEAIFWDSKVFGRGINLQTSDFHNVGGKKKQGPVLTTAPLLSGKMSLNTWKADPLECPPTNNVGVAFGCQNVR